uniref:Uncharacterized protein n=1 Tax=Agrobacterium albertimagni TaxID=147266 RepID=A0A7C1NX58_9HYPH
MLVCNRAEISVQPTHVVAGEKVKVSWKVEGADVLGLGGSNHKHNELSGSLMVRMTDEITASNAMSTKHDTVTVAVDRGRLVFLGMQGVPARVDQAVRPDVENVFRSRGYEIVALDAGSSGIADYVAKSVRTAPEWRRSSFGTPFGKVDRATVEITITLSLQRIMDGSQLTSATGRGGAAITGFQSLVACQEVR